MNIHRRGPIHSRNSVEPGVEAEDSQISSESETDELLNYDIEAAQNSTNRNSTNSTLDNRRASIDACLTNPAPAPVHKDSGISKTWPAIFASIFLLVAVMLWQAQQKSERSCAYESLRQQYPQQDSSIWLSLSVGIEDILNERSSSPGVYLFVHQGGAKVHALIKEIAAESSHCFGHEVNPVEMLAEDFTSERAINDYGYAIEKYKSKIKEGHVILIANLNEIPPEAARALHAICDTHSPIAKNVVIFLSLVIPQTGNPLQNAHDTLFDLWASKLDRKDLDPLLTRVTDQVIPLQN